MDQPVKLQDSQPAETPWISSLAAWLFKKNFPAKILVVEEVILYNGLLQSLI